MRDAFDLYRELDAYDDARPAPDVVHAYLLAAGVSNGNQQMIDHAFAAAGLTDRLDSLLSVEDVGAQA